MKKTVFAVIIFISFVLVQAVCAQENIENAERVYESVALSIDFKDLEGKPMTAIVTPMFKSPWIGDGLGIYPVDENGTVAERPLVRKVWRTVVTDGEDYFLCPAVINRFGTYLFTVCPGRTGFDFADKKSAVISGSGKYALTATGSIIEFDFEKFQEDKEYRREFFEKNFSQIQRESLIDVSPETEIGKAFVSDLRRMFPREYYVKGKMVSVDMDISELKKLASTSNNAKYMRRVVEKGGLPNVGASSIIFPPAAAVELARMFIVWIAAATDDTLNGSFFESKVTGYQAGQAMSGYLANCQEEIDYLEKYISARERR